MCKEDPCKHLLQLDEELAKSIPDISLTSPGTSSEAVIEPHRAPCVVSSASAISSDLASASNTAVFFARVPPTLPHEELLELFSKFGVVRDLNLFRRWATAKTSKGCGTVQYSRPEEASAAMLALNGVHTFVGYPGCEGPMVVEWMDASRLTAPGDAAHKSARVRDTNKALARPQQHKPRNKGSTSSNAPCRPPGWQFLQSVNTMHACALAAAAAATAGCCMMPHSNFTGLHPAVEALDVSGLLLSTPLAEHQGTCGTPGLGDPANWGSVVPVHLLPMMGQSRGPINMNAANPGSLSPLLPSAAAAMCQMGLNPALQSAPAAAAAGGALQMMASSDSNTGVLSGLLPSPLGCPTPSIEPWLSGGLPTCSDTSLSYTSCVGPTFAHTTSSFLAAAVAQQQAQQQQQLAQQAQLRPLMIFEDAWPGQTCEEAASAGTNAAPGGGFNSSSFSLLDSATQLMGGRYSDVMTAGGQSGARHTIQDGSSMLAGYDSCPAPAVDAAAQGNATGFLSGHLTRVLSGEGDTPGFLSPGRNSLAPVGVMSAPVPWASSHDGYLSMQGGAKGTASSAQPVRQCSNAAGQTVLKLSLTDVSLGLLALSIPKIAEMSGAEVRMTVSPTGTELSLQGTAIEVEAARNLMHLLCQGGGGAASSTASTSQAVCARWWCDMMLSYRCQLRRTSLGGAVLNFMHCGLGHNHGGVSCNFRPTLLSVQLQESGSHWFSQADTAPAAQGCVLGAATYLTGTRMGVAGCKG